MQFRLVGCTHHRSPVAVRERLAFSASQATQALAEWHARYPNSEAVLLSTCNRMEFYTASESDDDQPTYRSITRFLADFHGLPAQEVSTALFEEHGESAVCHLFRVSAGLDSMVLGEPQILGQVRRAYRMACELESTGPITHHVFQAALRVARRVAAETTINQRRLSVPGVAIVDFASQIFESLDDKSVVLIGAGKMAEETVRYLLEQGAQRIRVLNRSPDRAARLARQCHGETAGWDTLFAACAAADLVVSTTGGDHPIVTAHDFRAHIEPLRDERPLMILDLALPRDFDPQVGQHAGVYLYSIDDLTEVCEQNRMARRKELPAAVEIVNEESARFMTEAHHRANAPIIQRLRDGWQKPKNKELERLIKRLPQLDEKARREIAISFDRLINKLLHPPLESLKDESRNGPPHGLVDALKRLFQIRD